MKLMMCSFFRLWRADWLASTKNMRHDALARTPVLALEFKKSMPPKTVLLQEPRAHTEPGAAVFMGAEERSHRAEYPQLAQTHLPPKLSALQTVSVLKHRMNVFGCNTWVGGHKVRGPACLVGREWEIPGGDTRWCPSMAVEHQGTNHRTSP